MDSIVTGDGDPNKPRSRRSSLEDLKVMDAFYVTQF